MKEQPLQVNSEIGRLRSIILHKPQDELHNLVPNNMERLLFDDLPDFIIAGREYDHYIEILENAGVEILFVDRLVAEALDAGGVRESFLRRFFADHNIDDEKMVDTLLSYFMDFKDNLSLVRKLISGLRKEEAPYGLRNMFHGRNGIADFFILDPLPNLYFTRDPFTIIGDTVSINTMYAQARHPEIRFAETIFTYHPRFKEAFIHDRQDARFHERSDHIEGGDILILSEEVVAIGISERTNKEGIKKLAKSMFANGGTKNLQYVLAFEIPIKRAYMHLDTVFTQLDRDCFVVHPLIEGELTVYEISKNSFAGDKLGAKEIHGTLEEILTEYSGIKDIRIIRCGGNSPVDAEREQWNDGANTLAIAPGEVIVYERNRTTNRLFEEAGIKIHQLPVSELVLGRGGPHCMSMPVYRDLLD